MKVLSLLIALMVSTFTLAEDGFIVTKKKLTGKQAIAEILDAESDWLTVTYGQDNNGNRCQSYILTSEDKEFLEVVMTDKEQRPTARFYVAAKGTFKFTREQNDGSDGEGVGFHTYDTYKIGKNTLRFEKAGDSYYEVAITVDGKTSACNVDF